MQLSQPIRCKINSNHNYVKAMFSSVLQAVCSLHADCFEFTLTPLIFPFFHQIGVGCTTESALACSNLQTGGKIMFSRAISKNVRTAFGKIKFIGR